MKGVLAEEVYGGEVEAGAAGGAAARLEDDGLGGELVEFFALGGGFGAVVVDQAAVLWEEGISREEVGGEFGQGAVTLEISLRSRSMVSPRYFLTIPIVATALALRVWITCSGAIKPSSSIFRRTISNSSPASWRILGLEVKYASAAGYSCGSSGPYFLNALIAPAVSLAEV